MIKHYGIAFNYMPLIYKLLAFVVTDSRYLICCAYFPLQQTDDFKFTKISSLQKMNGSKKKQTTILPLGERSESPPMRPFKLKALSPC